MLLKIFEDATALARAAAKDAAMSMQKAIVEKGRSRLVLATGNSQIKFLEILTANDGINWTRVEAFHLDEYVGLATTHPACFRKFLLERVIRKTGIAQYHLVEGDARDLSAAIREVSTQLMAAPIDLAFVGIGENGHIAFNDPPADFATEEPYIVVELDQDCRRQQVGEGWFGDIAEVPRRAISMTPRQMMKACEILAVVPDLRKARAVKMCFEGDIGPAAPASILRTHPRATVYLDRDSASLLRPEIRKETQRVV